ncbi:MAG: VCBS repeat-containing protein [Candidatus Paceibacterota bacterium]
MSIKNSKALFILIVILSFISCSSEPDTKFKSLPPSQTGIHFSNDLETTPEFNIRNYLYFYDGGGVAVGDINNDGLPDLFFVGNQVENRLYLNKGNFIFEDITESAGITHHEGSWSTGVTMADITGNGFLDIYVSKVNYLSVSGANQLFINNGDETFTEMAAEYGLDFEGYSTQAAFFDYNQNGRLDMFLLNHSFHSEDTYGEAETLRQRPDPKGGDRLFRNDGDYFTDVTQESGIISSALGYGLGVAITDVNQDGFPDVYVGNDFHEDDYFYINNGDGTFSEMLYSMFGHTSNSSMGNDVGDINNDGLMDIISLDMMSEDHETFMRSGGPDLKIVADAKRNFGFGAKNNRNTLQINRGNSGNGLPLFSETAFASGVAKTDWSWAALFADLDNDGYNDLFVSNGMPRRPNDLDVVAALNRLRQQFTGAELEQKEYELISLMPDVVVPNYLFRNEGNLQFKDVSTEWWDSIPTSSSGSVYADLNNNGFLDLVVNNIDRPPFIYQNSSVPNDSTHYLEIKLNGETANTTGIGSKVFIYNEKSIYYREQMPTRGFQSSVDHTLHFGLGEHQQIDSLLIIWPDDRYETLYDIQTNQTLILNQTDASGSFNYNHLHEKISAHFFTDITSEINFSHRHRENSFDDQSREPLMPYKHSQNGPALAVGDVNGDGLDDFYMGGSRSFEGKLFLQKKDGTFLESEQQDFISDRHSEDVDALFFDATGDGNLDLYVVSGGNEYPDNSVELIDRLYINTGEGQFRKSINSLPEYGINGSVVKAADINGDDHLDLFVGGHSIPWRYGVGPQNLILLNNGRGVFSEVTNDIAPELETIGNVTSAEWIQNPNSEYPDLIIAGEWMPIVYFENQGDQLVRRTTDFGFENTTGLWQTLTVSDLTGNGYPDIIAGNFGMNSRLTASPDTPINLYVNDFDANGQTAPLITYFPDGVERPFEQLDELIKQIPDLTKSITSYRDFANRDVSQLVDSELLNVSLKKQLVELRSLVLINDGDGKFQKNYLLFEAQLFPIKSILPYDIDNNGSLDLLLAGNKYAVKPSFGGRQDAGYGLTLKNNGAGKFTPYLFNKTGFLVKGEGRSIHSYQNYRGENHVIVARNNDIPLFFKFNSNE